MLEIGDNAVEFVLKDHNEKNVSLKDYKGKWLVLYFYPKDDTPGCTKEACDFTDSLNDFRSLDATVLGVSPDGAAVHQKFIAKYDLSVTLLSDPDKKMMEAYGAWGLKKNYGREFMGVIRSTFIIDPQGKIAARWAKVQVRMKRKAGEVKHADLVKAKLLTLKNNI